jgi:molybdate/tungstate transport system substrate-binding protein
MSERAQALRLRVLYAGSLQSLVLEDLFPRFARLTGYRCEGQAGGSREWARQLRLRQVQADLLLSADASVNEVELMRPGEEVAEWYLAFASNELVLAYSEASPATRQMHDAARDEKGWQRLLQLGLRLGRPDPEVDPKGYRTLFALRLAEVRLGLPGFVEAVAGTPRNPEQLFEAADLTPMLQRGELDLMLCYRSQAKEAGLPFVTLPAEMNLGSPELADAYAAASYRCADGTTYRGAPIAYTATPVTDAPHPLAAAAFLAFLTSDEATEAVARHGFRAVRAITRPRAEGS